MGWVEKVGEHECPLEMQKRICIVDPLAVVKKQKTASGIKKCARHNAALQCCGWTIRLQETVSTKDCVCRKKTPTRRFPM